MGDVHPGACCSMENDQGREEKTLLAT